MSKKSIGFGVTDGKGNRSSTWICSAANPPKNDVYLACREIDGALKASLHESGNWHLAYDQRFFDDNVSGIDRTDKGRFIEQWSKPPEIAPGVIPAFRMVIPWGSVKTPIDNNVKKNIHWANQPSDGYAIELYPIISAKGFTTSDWPGKNGMNTQLVGSFQISNGESIWVVYREILMPKISQQSGNFRFYEHKNEDALKSNNLRMQALDVAEDGSRVLYDFYVQYKRKST